MASSELSSTQLFRLVSALAVDPLNLLIITTQSLLVILPMFLLPGPSSVKASSLRMLSCATRPTSSPCFVECPSMSRRVNLQTDQAGLLIHHKILRPARRLALLAGQGVARAPLLCRYSGLSTLTLARSLLAVGYSSSKPLLACIDRDCPGRDITTLGVEDLRSHLTLIPQDTVLYSGTIRENLDPFNQHTDSECLDVLKMVQLSVDVADGGLPVSAVAGAQDATPAASGTSTPAQTNFMLDSKVSEGGNNYSAGQRQLIAMAVSLVAVRICSSSLTHNAACPPPQFRHHCSGRINCISRL